MSNNAFAVSSAPSSLSQKKEISFAETSQNSSHIISENSYVSEKISFLHSFSKASAEQKMMMIGGGVLFVGLLFVIVSSFGGTDLKASLANQAPPSSENSVETVSELQTEIVYKDQYGNILTEEQVQKILNPETISLTQPLPEGEGQNKDIDTSTNIVTYPEISGENVTVDTTKDTLFVKKEDAEKLLAENRLVRKIVDNRPIYVEPITGAIVELIQPIERPLAGRTSFIPAPPSVVSAPAYLRGSSLGEVSRGAVSSGEITRITGLSSGEIGR